MRRLFITLCSLTICSAALLSNPRLLAAAPPPPCPHYETFIMCAEQCPISSSQAEAWCLDLIMTPPDCIVIDWLCDGAPFGVCDPWTQRLWCTYRDRWQN